MKLPDLSVFLKTPPERWPELVHRRLRPSKAAVKPKDTRAKTCTFVLSTGRVGSKTLAELGNLCQGLVATHEPRPRLYGLSAAAYSVAGAPAADRVLLEAVTACRSGAIEGAYSSGCDYLETSPQGTFLAPFVAQAFEGVRFIHLVRNPADVVRSGMRRKWFDGHGMDSTRIRPGAGSLVAVNWDAASVFERNCWLWAETNRWILQALAKLPDVPQLTLKTEDVTRGEERTLAALFAFLGVQHPAKAAIDRLLRRPINAQQDGDFPHADAWDQGLHQSLRRIAGEVAAALGYTV